jgi:hypothetical protein
MKRTRNDKTPGCSKNIWLPGVPKSERVALWQRLTALSQSLGYNTPAVMLIAIDAGELQIEKGNSDASNLST